MLTLQPTSEQTTTAPRPLRWRVVTPDRAVGLEAGDVLAYDPTAPKGSRLTIERPARLHEGHVDRMQLRGALVPIEGTILDARRCLVLRLLHDREDAESGAVAA